MSINKITTRKVGKTNIINAIRAMEDNYIYITFMEGDNKVYIKDTRNTSTVTSK